VNIVLVHNYYRQRGGEDEVFEAEGELLEAHGHVVTRYTVHNAAVADMSKTALAKATIVNRQAYRGLRRLFRTARPHVVHVHNTFPLISPTV
jgi:hypothetical protein